jgi:anti-sigma factor RsiW
MRSLATPNKIGCPSVEDLAAYIDEGLSRPERAAITAHFSECDNCFSLYIEAVQALIDQQEREGG